MLGDAFDPESRQSRDDLEASIVPAIGRLRSAADLPSIARLSNLKLGGGEVAIVITLLTQVEAEAATLAELAADPHRARRVQLYARVSAWMHDHAHADDGTCPVCVGQLHGARDPVTGTPVIDHLAEAARDREVIARTIADWSAHWVGRLLQELPPVIAREARGDLPQHPAALARTGLVDGLFASGPFRGALSAMRPDATRLTDERLAALPGFTDLAGVLAVAIADRMVARGHVELGPDGGRLTEDGAAFLHGIGVDPSSGSRRRGAVFCRPCLDWSERRPHIAGAVGAALCTTCLDRGWLRRVDGSRALIVSPAGRLALDGAFGPYLADW